MNQCVPSWDLDDPSAGLNNNTVPSAAAHHRAAAGQQALVVPMSDQYYEVAELTWEQGNISSHGLLNRPPPPNKYPSAASAQQLQAIGGGGAGDRETLEAVVGEAAARSHFQQPLPATPWLGVVADALVPCARDEQEAAEEKARTKRARVDGQQQQLVVVCASQGSAAPGMLAACGTGPDDVCGFTTATTNNSTSLELDRENDNKGSPDTENTSIGGGASDSRCFSRRSQANLLLLIDDHTLPI